MARDPAKRAESRRAQNERRKAQRRIARLEKELAKTREEQSELRHSLQYQIAELKNDVLDSKAKKGGGYAEGVIDRMKENTKKSKEGRLFRTESQEQLDARQIMIIKKQMRKGNDYYDDAPGFFTSTQKYWEKGPKELRLENILKGFREDFIKEMTKRKGNELTPAQILAEAEAITIYDVFNAIKERLSADSDNEPTSDDGKVGSPPESISVVKILNAFL